MSAAKGPSPSGGGFGLRSQRNELERKT